MKLKPKFGFWEVFCIAAGAMISSGLFVLPGIAFARAGPGVVLAYGLAGVMVVPAMLAQAELVSAMPKAGGTYFFVERSMGALPGTLAGLANWLSLSLKSAFALIGIGAMLRLIRPDAPMVAIKAIAIAGCVVFTVLNLVSAERAGRLQILLVAGLLTILGAFVVAGFGSMEPANFEGFFDTGPLAILATAGLVFVSFGGLTKVASIAEEVRRPGRNIPAGMFAASMVVTGLYVAVAAVVVGNLDSRELANNLEPVATAARKRTNP